MKLRVRAMGFAGGASFGLAIFVASLISAIFGSGETIGRLNFVLPGFQRSFVGVIIGMIDGFVIGFIAAAILAWLYNTFHKMLYKSEKGG